MGFIKLGFIGTYKIDLFHYFSRILRALGKNVIIIDASEDQNLLVTLPESEEDCLVTLQGIDYLIDQKNMDLLDQVLYSDYDVALIDYGFNSEVAFDYSSCHILFVITDFQKHHVLKLKELVYATFSPEFNVVKLFRDVVECKISGAYINRVLDMDDKAKILAEYLFYLNESDYECQLISQYDDVFKFVKLSKEYKMLFLDILEELYSLKRVDIIKAIKLAEGAKICK